MGLSVLIGTPTTKELVHTVYCQCIASVVANLRDSGAGVALTMVDGHDIETQRDRIAAEFLESSATHLLMVDSDTGFDGALIPKLLATGYPVTGIVSPWRYFDLDAAEQATRNGLSVRDALANSYKFNVSIGRPHQSGQFIRVDHIGAAIILIARECFEQIELAGVETYRNRVNGKMLKGFFRRMESNGELLTEDYAFCKRWRDVGGEVWAYPFADVTHIGIYPHVGNFAKQLKARTRLG